MMDQGNLLPEGEQERKKLGAELLNLEDESIVPTTRPASGADEEDYARAMKAYELVTLTIEAASARGLLGKRSYDTMNGIGSTHVKFEALVRLGFAQFLYNDDRKWTSQSRKECSSSSGGGKHKIGSRVTQFFEDNMFRVGEAIKSDRQTQPNFDWDYAKQEAAFSARRGSVP